MKHCWEFKQQFGSLKMIWNFPMENFLSFLRKMLHSTGSVNAEFMTAGNYNFFGPKMQKFFDVDVHEIFGTKSHKILSVDNWGFKHQIAAESLSEQQILFSKMILKFFDNKIQRIHDIPEDFHFFQKALDLHSQKRIWTDDFPVKAERRNHFVHIFSQNSFGFLKAIGVQGRNIGVVVEMLEIDSFLDERQTYPIIKEKQTNNFQAIWFKDIEPVGYFPQEIDNENCIIPLY